MLEKSNLNFESGLVTNKFTSTNKVANNTPVVINFTPPGMTKPDGSQVDTVV
jgi:hypothetical protein